MIYDLASEYKGMDLKMQIWINVLVRWMMLISPTSFLPTYFFQSNKKYKMKYVNL